ncbi:hypothetical protein B0H14DRAFT_2656581 [Mycena olivaceomarginata]|nr:hypothetical protein B0H14DRAFT_2656581 [Mycena olivaceomarginata]
MSESSLQPHTHTGRHHQHPPPEPTTPTRMTGAPNLTLACMSAQGRTSALDPSDVHQDLGTPLTSSTQLFLTIRKLDKVFSGTSTLTTTTYMGRRAKYLTNDERASAHREENARYYQHASAQFVRAASHRAHYVNRTSGLEYQRPMRCIPHLPPLSQEIHRLHQKRLPVSAVLYQDALNSDNIVLSNEALPRWMAKPPFLMDEDEDGPILGGLSLEDDRQRRLDLAAKGWVVFMDVLREEVVQLLRNWETE